MALHVRHALITGGSSGIGLALARRLAPEGAHLSLLARDPMRLQQVRCELLLLGRLPGQQVTVLPCDVTDEAAVVQAVAAATTAAGVPDLVITAAGMVEPGVLAQQPAALVTQTMAVNFWGTFFTLRSVLPHMQALGRGHLVLIASGAALVGIYGYAAYSASKFALRGLAEALRTELRPAGVGVSIVYPPDTDTPMLTYENSRKPAATRAITSGAGIMSADAVARATLRGVERGAFTIAPGVPMLLLAYGHSLLAPLVRWQMDQIVRRLG